MIRIYCQIRKLKWNPIENSRFNYQNKLFFCETSKVQPRIDANFKEKIIASTADNKDCEKVSHPPTPGSVPVSNINGDSNTQSTKTSTTPLHTNTSSTNKSSTISSTFQIAGQTYEDLERNLMKRISESNQRRFRLIFISIIFLIAWILTFFGQRLRKFFTEHTAGLAKETLENESLKIQTQELAMAVVQTILNDPGVTNRTSAFLKKAAMSPDTQQAIVKLTLHVLQHPQSLEAATKLAKKIFVDLSKDQETMNCLTDLFCDAIQDNKIKIALVQLLGELSKDPEVLQLITDLTLKVIGRNEVLEATNELLTTSTKEVLKDELLIRQSKDFVTEVMGDDVLQKEGGDALFKSISHALRPGLIRILGVSLIGLSVFAYKVFINPY